MAGRQQGQIFPLMAGILLTVLALGLLLFTVAKAGILRSEAQTAADAAALGAVRDTKRQLDAMTANGGIASVGAIQDASVRAAADDYAKRNGARVVDYDRRGVDVKIWVKTEDELDGEAAREVGVAGREGAARARARIEVTSMPAGYAGASAGPSGYAAGGGNGKGDGKVSDKEWERFKREELDDEPPTCTDNGPSNDVIKLGRFLDSKGFIVGENSAFKGPTYGIGRSPNSWHYQCGEAGAIDLNWTSGQSDLEMSKMDPLIGPLQELGFATIWRTTGHWDHLHIDAGPSSMGAGSGGGGFGFGDQAMEIRLIDWEAEYESFNPYPNDAPIVDSLGTPDPRVMQIMCSVLAQRKVSDRVRLATFETAIVESTVRNLSGGDRTSVGVFQQQDWWGTFEQRTNVAYATNKFLNGNGPPGAIELDKTWKGKTGLMAQEVQQSGHPERYDAVAGQAASLHNKACGQPKISPSD